MLARQLLIGFLAVIVPCAILLGGAVGYSLISMDRVSSERGQVSRSREAVTDLHVTLMQAGAPLGSFLLTGDSANQQRFETLIQAAETRLQSCGAAPCHGSHQTPARMAAKLAPAIEMLKRNGRLVFEEGAGGGMARVEAVRRTITGVRSATEPMLEAVRARGLALERQADAVRRRAWILMVALTGTIVLTGAAAAMVIARRLSRPLNDLLLGIRRVMAGDWSYQARTKQRGEIGELASAFNAMVREVREHRAQVEGHHRAQVERLTSLGLLASGVAHELNNPLTSIVMNANLMSEEVGEDTALFRGLKKIDADAARCRRIIEDLRAFARVPQIERAATEVGSVVEQALSAAAHDLERGHIVIERDLPPDLPKILWDPSRMVQVLTNLLVNAAQAVDGGGGRVVIRARCDGGWLRLEVEDDAAGIPATARSRIFDPFFTTKPDGTGLGLSISHGIVNEHGGRIEVESRTREEVGPAGKTGTTVRVVVPIGDPAA